MHAFSGSSPNSEEQMARSGSFMSLMEGEGRCSKAHVDIDGRDPFQDELALTVLRTLPIVMPVRPADVRGLGGSCS